MDAKNESKTKEKRSGSVKSYVRVQPTKDRVLARILADSLLGAKAYVDRWVVNRGAE